MRYSFYTKKYSKNTQRGFTILETMVAIFILILSITGPMVFASSSLRSAFLARDQITAFYLAQDIIEVIKNTRDENGINGDPWLSNIDVCDASDPVCIIYIDTTDADPVANECPREKEAIDPPPCNPLTKDSAGRFTYGDTESRFTRTTYVKETVSNQEAQVVVEVSWQSNVRIGTKRILVQENIMNWIPLDDEA
jgi:Tfp pilus assembly protein PilV